MSDKVEGSDNPIRAGLLAKVFHGLLSSGDTNASYAAMTSPGASSGVVARDFDGAIRQQS